MTGALKPYLARSAGLHALALAAAGLLAGRGAIKADKVYMIDFVGGTTLQSSAASAEPAKGPAEPPAPSKPAPQTDPDSIEQKRKPGAALPRPSLLRGASEPRELPKPSMSQGGAAAQPSAGAEAGPGGSAGVSTDLPNFPYPWYISQVRLMLWNQWKRRMPPSGGDGNVVFSILRNGGMTDLRVESSSGDLDFDKAAIESVQAAAPFPALPSDFPEPFLKIHLALRAESSWR